ncbi:MAG: hypothetical protein JRN42_01900 [Nitrososphaerota archaeon]|nr:hypothetical protein [Nitrososphaerota archaeon]
MNRPPMYEGLKTDVSPMWLTYYMVDWSAIKQEQTEQRCTICGRTLSRTETVTDGSGPGFVGYVCHADKQVTWVKAV